jgi:hypothetical protein
VSNPQVKQPFTFNQIYYNGTVSSNQRGIYMKSQ